MNRLALAFVLAASVVACKSSVKSSSSSGSGGSSSSATGTGSGPGVGATTSTTGTGGSANTFTFTMDSFDVPPGKEVYKCQNFANPFGAAVDVGAFESHMTKGSHHLLLFYKPGIASSPLSDCSGLEFAATPYSTQLPDDQVTFPSGVAAEIPSTTGFRLQSHYLNTTGQTITAHVTMTLHLVDASTVTSPAGVMFIVQPNIDIAPMSTQTVTYDCTVPQDMQMLKVQAHMHQHGTLFTSTLAGQPLYNTMTWSEPAAEFFNPPLQAHAGDHLHFECTFQNTGTTPLTFGESAQTNEMCILAAAFYPAPPGVATIDCK